MINRLLMLSDPGYYPKEKCILKSWITAVRTNKGFP